MYLREEIASCMEAAYKRMLFTEAGNMLYFKKQEELVEFAKEVNFILKTFLHIFKQISINIEFYSSKRKWSLASNNFFYFQQKPGNELENNTIPASDLVLQMVEYAKELEIIV